MTTLSFLIELGKVLEALSGYVDTLEIIPINKSYPSGEAKFCDAVAIEIYMYPPIIPSEHAKALKELGFILFESEFGPELVTKKDF